MYQQYELLLPVSDKEMLDISCPIDSVKIKVDIIMIRRKGEYKKILLKLKYYCSYKTYNILINACSIDSGKIKVEITIPVDQENGETIIGIRTIK